MKSKPANYSTRRDGCRGRDWQLGTCVTRRERERRERRRRFEEMEGSLGKARGEVEWWIVQVCTIPSPLLVLTLLSLISLLFLCLSFSRSLYSFSSWTCKWEEEEEEEEEEACWKLLLAGWSKMQCSTRWMCVTSIVLASSSPLCHRSCTERAQRVQKPALKELKAGLLSTSSFVVEFCSILMICVSLDKPSIPSLHLSSSCLYSFASQSLWFLFCALWVHLLFLHRRCVWTSGRKGEKRERERERERRYRSKETWSKYTIDTTCTWEGMCSYWHELDLICVQLRAVNQLLFLSFSLLLILSRLLVVIPVYNMLESSWHIAQERERKGD